MHAVLLCLATDTVERSSIEPHQTFAAANGGPAEIAALPRVTSDRPGSHSRADAAQTGRKVALVFGREADGLTDGEVARCSALVSLPMGRFQESLSLSHAVALVLGQLYERRLAVSAADTSGTECDKSAPQLE